MLSKSTIKRGSDLEIIAFKSFEKKPFFSSKDASLVFSIAFSENIDFVRKKIDLQLLFWCEFINKLLNNNPTHTFVYMYS